ncbi:MAG TPA: sigma-70 family RNA polymerase sigma factor [Polyangiales bacterium]|jgi:RNA polymerase sigma-70 factor (ECF subfamily)|nr:sigma-70 family RNA polymerase sigma factor [Polyangiales bacterium]
MSTKTKEAVGMGSLAAPTGCGPQLFVTDYALPGHSEVRCVNESARKLVSLEPEQELRTLVFSEVYEAQFDFVWRSARRLGVSALHLDDVVQEVFLVVHRRLAEFEARSSLKTWLFAITRRVVGDYRRSARRKPSEPIGNYEPEASASCLADARLARDEDARLLYALLDELDEDKREVFVLAELEQMSGPEIAEALSENVNTVYARLRAARGAFEAAVARHHARSRRAL